MDDRDQTARERDEPEPGSDASDPDRRTQRGDAHRRAQAAERATFGDAPSTRNIVPGVFSGDLGPKGRVSSQLRELSRTERVTYGDVPRGTFGPHGFRVVLLPLLAFAVILLLVIALIAWWLS